MCGFLCLLCSVLVGCVGGSCLIEARRKKRVCESSRASAASSVVRVRVAALVRPSATDRSSRLVDLIGRSIDAKAQKPRSNRSTDQKRSRGGPGAGEQNNSWAPCVGCSGCHARRSELTFDRETVEPSLNMRVLRFLKLNTSMVLYIQEKVKPPIHTPQFTPLSNNRPL